MNWMLETVETLDGDAELLLVMKDGGPIEACICQASTSRYVCTVISRMDILLYSIKSSLEEAKKWAEEKVAEICKEVST